MIIVDDIEQGSEEWLNARLGMPTASCFERIVTASGGLSAQSSAYMGQLMAEHITRRSQMDFMSDDMIRGNELEPFARQLYEGVTGNKTRQVGIVYADTEDRGCSPDGLLDHGGLEIKSPKLSNHIGYVIEGVIPKKYIPQVQGCMYICERDQWDFMSYHPDYEPLIITVTRDDKFIKKLDNELDKFCEKLAELKARLLQRAEF